VSCSSMRVIVSSAVPPLFVSNCRATAELASPPYFLSALDPAGLNPLDILCAASWPSLTNVHVRTPRLAGAFSAYAAAIKAMTDTHVSTIYRMATFLLTASDVIALNTSMQTGELSAGLEVRRAMPPISNRFLFCC
jgi:hypothetical protein